MTTTEILAPVRRSVTVGCDPAAAFELFTAGMGHWWPLETHAIAVDRETGQRAVAVVFEPRVGGEVLEVADDGSRAHWATVLAWDPPRGFLLAWQPNVDRPAPSELELRFTAVAEGTLVELEHRGWERLGDGAAQAREGYASEAGWVTTLRHFAAAVEAGRR
jgi:uncharacterized protein YndB with AHSA1/START domain